jgi:hypothetical protein
MNPATWVAIVTSIIGVSMAFIVATSFSSGGPIPVVMVLAFIGFMFYFFFKYLIRPVMNAIRLKKDGVPGTARIMSVKNTGMIINNNPVLNLEVEIKDAFGHRYTTSIKTLGSRTDPNLYQAGMEVPIKIDPLKKENAIIDDESKPSKKTAIAAPQIKTEWEQTQEETANILSTGRPARAIIKKYNWLGSYANGNNPVVELELEVFPELYSPFEGKTRTVIPEAKVYLYQQGCEVKVRYDLYDYSKIVIDPN